MANLDLAYGPDDRTLAFENHLAGYLISLAGPGTGKTYSLLKRIDALIAAGVSHDDICYLTFIKEISKAFVLDYIEKFGKDSYEAHKPRISTLHSFACLLLRNLGYQIGYQGELFFLNSTDTEDDASQTFLADLLPSINRPACRTVPQLRDHIDQIKGAWQDGLDPLTLAAPLPTILAQAETLFRAFRVVDWDQTIPLAHSLAEAQNGLPGWIADIDHYLIDEYQDFNKAEQSLIRFLSGQATSVVIVGDDDQSLYSGRGGSPDGIRNLYADAAHDHVSLVKCHRCRTTIITAANNFERTLNPHPRPLQSVKPDGEILVHSFKSSKAELAFLSEYLLDCIAHLPDPPSPKDGIVCLFSNWRILDFYFEKLSPLLPAIKRRTDFPPDRLWLERVLSLFCRPEQRFLERLLLNEYSEIKPRHKRLVIQHVLQNDVSVIVALAALIADGGITGVAATKALQFCQFIADVSSRDPDRISPHVAQKLNVDAGTIPDRLTAIAEHFDQPDLEDTISQQCDLILPISARPVEDPRSVSFLTIHGSKGLTKRTVVLPGLEEACLPGGSQGPDLDEKRRLFFVALTRAIDRVLITYPFTRARKDPLNYQAPGRGACSSFVRDAGLVDVYHP